MSRPLADVVLGLAVLGAALASAPEKTAPIPFVSANASSVGGVRSKYGPQSAIDRDLRTRWAGHSKLPQWIQVEFAQATRVDELRVRGVQSKNYDNWQRVAVSFSNGHAFALTLADTHRQQIVAFPVQETRWIRLTIESTHKHTKYVGCGEVEARFTGHKRSQVHVATAKPPPKKPWVVMRAEREPKRTARFTRLWDDARQHLAQASKGTATGQPHPNLWVNAEDIERAKRAVRDKPWARAWLRDVIKAADEWAARSDEAIRRSVPPKHARFHRRLICPRCEGRSFDISLDRPGQVYCAECKIVFPNADYPDGGMGWTNPATGDTHVFVQCYNGFAIHEFDRGLRALADAYALTGEERYAHTAAVLFDALAVIYRTCDRGPEWYPSPGGRLNRPYYQTSRKIIHYADHYDLLHNSHEWDKPSIDPRYKTRRQNFEENFLANSGAYCLSQMDDYGGLCFHNGFLDYLQGVVAVGRVLDIPQFMDYALESHVSVFNFLENALDRDGQYHETAFMYSSHMLSLFSHHAEMLRYYRSDKFPDGINLYDHPNLKLAFLRSERDVLCAGRVPPLGDTGPDVRVVRPPWRPNGYVYARLEYLAARVSDPRERATYMRMLRDYVGDVEEYRAGSGLRRWLIFNAAPAGETGAGAKARRKVAPVRNTLLPGNRGIGILRAGPAGETAALLRWGPTRNHGQPDELNVNFFAHGREITYDPGYLWANVRLGWTRTTGSHNLVVVNEKNQRGGRGAGNLEMWLEAPGVRGMSANDPPCYSQERPSRYQRTVALVDVSPTRHYLLDVFRVAGGHTHDLNWHFVGEMSRVHGLTLPPPQTTGSLAGPQYEWWKAGFDIDGFLLGVKHDWSRRFPPGNGYGFIFNLQRAPGAGPCAFDWEVGQRAAIPKGVFHPGNHVGKTSGKHHRQIKEWYFYRGKEPGDFIEYDLPVKDAGEYLVVAAFLRNTHNAIIQAALDGQPMGEPFNAYSPRLHLTDPIVLGRRRLQPGTHRLRFTVTGRDPKSQGHFFSIKYLAFASPDFMERLRDKQTEMVRLRLLPPPGVEVIVGRARTLDRLPQATYVISHRKSAGQAALSTQFASLVEPFAAESEVISFDRLAPAAGADADSVAALRVGLRDGRVDYFFESPHPSAASDYIFGKAESAERVRFAGRFGVARTRGGEAERLILHGPGLLEVAGRQLQARPQESGFRGRVVEVDLERRAVYTDAALPSDGRLCGCVIQFSNPAWPQRAPFQVKNAVREGSRTRIGLDAASLILARGMVGSDKAAPGVIANLVPLDLAWRSFFEGKPIVADDGADLGRFKELTGPRGTWHFTSTRPVSPPAGLRFSIVEVSSGDEFTIDLTTVKE